MDANMWNLLNVNLQNSMVNRNLSEQSLSMVNRGLAEPSLSLVNCNLAGGGLSMVNRGTPEQASLNRGLSGQVLSMLNREQMSMMNRTIPEQAFYLMNQGILDESLTNVNRTSEQSTTNLPTFLEQSGTQQQGSAYLPYPTAMPQFSEASASYASHNEVSSAEFRTPSNGVQSSNSNSYRSQSTQHNECRFLPPAHSNRNSGHSSMELSSMYPLNLSSSAQIFSEASVPHRQPMPAHVPAQPAVSERSTSSQMLNHHSNRSYLQGTSSKSTTIPNLPTVPSLLPVENMQRLMSYSRMQEGVNNEEPVYGMTPQPAQSPHFSNSPQEVQHNHSPTYTGYAPVPHMPTSPINMPNSQTQPHYPAILDPSLSLPAIIQAQADSTTKKGQKAKAAKPKSKKKGNTGTSDNIPPKTPEPQTLAEAAQMFAAPEAPVNALVDEQLQSQYFWGHQLLNLQSAYNSLGDRQLTELQSVNTDLDGRSYLRSSALSGVFEELNSATMFTQANTDFNAAYPTVDSSCLQQEPDPAASQQARPAPPAPVDPEFEHLASPTQRNAPLSSGGGNTFKSAKASSVKAEPNTNSNTESVKSDSSSQGLPAKKGRDFQNSFLSFLQGNKGETLSSVSNSTITAKPELPKYNPEFSNLPVRQAPMTSEEDLAMLTKPIVPQVNVNRALYSPAAKPFEKKEIVPPTKKRRLSGNTRKSSKGQGKEEDIKSAEVTIQKVQVGQNSSIPLGGSVTRVVSDAKEPEKPPITLKINLTKLQQPAAYEKPSQSSTSKAQKGRKKKSR